MLLMKYPQQDTYKITMLVILAFFQKLSSSYKVGTILYEGSYYHPMQCHP